MSELILVIPTALIFDFLFGDPDLRIYPVRLMETSATGSRRLMKKIGLRGTPAGLLILTLSVLVFLGCYVCLAVAFYRFLPSSIILVLNGFLLYTLISFRSRFTPLLDLVEALRENDVEKGRQMVQSFLKRDVDQLDLPGLARASVEQSANGFLFGLLSPLFWYVVGGGIGLFLPVPATTAGISLALFVRTTNRFSTQLTLPGFREDGSGLPAFFLDRFLNFPPALLSPLVLFPVLLMVGGDVKHAFYILIRDRAKHHQPDTGMIQNLIAGALHLRLGGPTIYPHGVDETPWIGEGTSNVTAVHIKETIKILLLSGLLSYMLFVGTTLLLVKLLPV